MHTSDPNLRQLGFFGQYGQTCPDPRETHPTKIWAPNVENQFCPTGRLRQAPQCLTVEPVWGEDGSISGIVDYDEYFINGSSGYGKSHRPLLNRDPIRHAFDDKWTASLGDSPYPKLRYAYPHWMSDQCSNPLGSDLSPRWYLYYGERHGLDGVPYSGPGASDVPNFPYGDCPWTRFEDTDSHVEILTQEGDDFPSLLQEGWGLFLLGTRLEFDGGVAVTYVFSFFIGYQLTTLEIILDSQLPENERSPALATPMLDLCKTSYWKSIGHTNFLNFPPHYVKLIPFRT